MRSIAAVMTAVIAIPVGCGTRARLANRGTIVSKPVSAAKPKLEIGEVGEVPEQMLATLRQVNRA